MKAKHLIVFALFSAKVTLAQFGPFPGGTTTLYNGQPVGIQLFSSTLTASASLDVQNNIAIRGSHLIFNSSAGVIDWGSAGSGDLLFRRLTTQGVTSAFNTYMVIRNSGNVGIGTSIAAPLTLLQVGGDVLASTATSVVNSAPMLHATTAWSSTSAPDYTWYGNTQTGLYHPASNVIGFSINNSEAMRIHSNSFVGIGTTGAPLAKLHVDNGAIRVTGSNPYGGPMVLLGGNVSTAPNGEWGMEYNTSVPGREGLNFWKPYLSTGTMGNYFLFLANSGHVGINTNNPTAQLTVNGNVVIGDPSVVCIPNANYKLFVQTGILTEQVKVAVNCSANWSDYVFDENYNLPALNDLHGYIVKNKHLPGIPSADEVVADGVDLGSMDAKLLAKIEELTLYVIQQNKKIEVLDQQVKDLQAK